MISPSSTCSPVGMSAASEAPPACAVRAKGRTAAIAAAATIPDHLTIRDHFMGLPPRVECQAFHPVYRPDAGRVLDLVTAAEPACHDGRASGPRADRREQAVLSDLHRYVVVLPLIPEGPGHSAAA